MPLAKRTDARRPRHKELTSADNRGRYAKGVHTGSGSKNSQIAQFSREVWLTAHLVNVTETHQGRTDLTSFTQLVQELIHNSVRRHTFAQCELELLFDLQNSRIRKSSRPDVLRRYLRAVQQHWAAEGSVLRLSSFLEQEHTPRQQVASPAAFISRQVAALPHAG